MLIPSKFNGYHNGARTLHISMGGGGGGGTTQTTSTVQNTNIPAYAEPYVNTMLGATQKQLFNTSEVGGTPAVAATYDDQGNQLTAGTAAIPGYTSIDGFKPYQAYGGTYDAQGKQLSYDPTKGIAGFTPDQLAAQKGIMGLQVPDQYRTAGLGMESVYNDMKTNAYTAPTNLGYTATGAKAETAGKSQDAIGSGYTSDKATAGTAGTSQNAVGTGYTSEAAKAATAGTSQNAIGSGYTSTAAKATDAATTGLGYTSSNAKATDAATTGLGYTSSDAKVTNAGTTGLGYTSRDAASQGYTSRDATSQGYTAAQSAAINAEAARLGVAPEAVAAQFRGPQDIASTNVSSGAPLTAFQMNAAQSQYAPTLTQYGMGAAPTVATKSFVDKGTAESYMSPYMQQVVDVQQREAQRQSDIAGQAQQAQAARSGAFGGSRDSIMRAEGARNLATQKSGIQAQGLQNAFQQAQQQFNAEQGYGLQGQIANQQAGLTVGQQNLGAQLGIQQLGTQTGTQIALANLSNSQQAAVQNQAAQLQAQGMTSSQALQAALANQSSGLQAAQANQGMAFNTSAQNAQLAQQAALANQSMQGQYGITQGQFSQAANMQTSAQAQQAALANAAATSAASQFGASAANQAQLANAAATSAASQFGASAANQASLAYAAAANQASLFGAGASNQAQLANAAAANQLAAQNAAQQSAASQFGAGASNQAQLANQAAANQMAAQTAAQQSAASQFGAGASNQAQLANQAAANQMAAQNAAASSAASQFGAAAGNQASLANQTAANQMSQYNAGLSQQTALANAAAANQATQFGIGAGNQASLANQTAANQMAQYNAGLGQQTSLANQAAANQAAQFGAGAGNQASLANQAATNQMAQYNAGLGQQTALANQAATNQAAQFGAAQGLTSAQTTAQYGLAGNALQLQAANQYAGLGQQQLAAQQGILSMQNQVGAQQQALDQAAKNQAIQDYANAQQYPLMQLGTMSNMLRGLPMQASTTNQYAASPNPLSTAIGTIGAGASVYNAMAPRSAAGGEVKGYAKGGILSYDMGGEVESQLENMDEKGLQAQARESSSPSIRKIAQRLLRERQMSKPQGAGAMGVQYQAAQPQMPSYKPGGIVAFAAGDTVYGGPSTEAGGEEDAKIGMQERLAQPAPMTPPAGGIMTAAPTTPIPSGPTAGRAMQQAPNIPDFMKAEYADTEKRMNAPLSSFMAERQAAMREAGVADAAVGQQEQRAAMMAEKANMADEKDRQKYMRLAEFFASWGSTPGPVLVAGLNALQKTVPNIVADEREQKKARREIDKSIADLDNATRLEKRGEVDAAMSLKLKAAEDMKALNMKFIDYQSRRESDASSFAATKYSADMQAESERLRARTATLDRAARRETDDDLKRINAYNAASGRELNLISKISDQMKLLAPDYETVKTAEMNAKQNDGKMTPAFVPAYEAAKKKIADQEAVWAKQKEQAARDSELTYSRIRINPQAAKDYTKPGAAPAAAPAAAPSGPISGDFQAPPAAAIAALKTNSSPARKADFDAMFGPGAADEYLGK